MLFFVALLSNVKKKKKKTMSLKTCNVSDNSCAKKVTSALEHKTEKTKKKIFLIM